MLVAAVVLLAPDPQLKKNMHEHLATGYWLGKFWYILTVEYLQLIKNSYF